MAETEADREARAHRRVWRFFRLLVGGGYPEDDKTMALAQRSVGRKPYYPYDEDDDCMSADG